jgi:transposase
LEWKARIATLYHLNRLRLQRWDPERALSEQSAAFHHYHEALQTALRCLHEEATRMVTADDAGTHREDAALSRGARTKHKKVLASLLEHWSGLTLFVEHPEVPMDNNRGENAIRNPVTGRKNYYGSGSLWSAELAATLFSLLQTLALWGINPRHWLRCYLDACADNDRCPPQDLSPFLPWSMDAARRTALSRPYPAQAPPAEPVSIDEST